LNAGQWADKWSRRLKGAGPDVEAGVNAVTTAPAAKAVAKQDKMRQNILNAIDSGRWANALGKVDLAAYKQAMINKGIPNMQRGVDSGLPKVNAYASVAIPHIQSGQQAIANMPDLTIEDSKARASKWIDHMHGLNYKGR
jgi:hypothetical protein